MKITRKNIRLLPRWLWVQFCKTYRRWLKERCEICHVQDVPLYSEWEILMCEKCILKERKYR